MRHPRQILKEKGLRPSKQRGQNFLVSQPTARAIAQSAVTEGQGVVVEIGPGLGALTLELALLAGKVIAVELDRGVFEALSGIVAQEGLGNVELRHGDALKLDWRALKSQAGGPVTVAGNLPYVISSQIIMDLVGNLACWSSATLMLQQEMAVRLNAKAGTKDYGRLTVLLRNFCELEMGRKVGPEQFHPRPAVSSRVIHIRPRQEPLVDVRGGDAFRSFSRVVKAAFSHRRKTLLNSLAGGLGLPKAEVSALLGAASIDPVRRAETLDVYEFGRMWAALES